MGGRFYVVGQIDATGSGSPHHWELEEIGAAKFPLFRRLGLEDVRGVLCGWLGARLEGLGMGEDWAATLEFFPEANVHVLYYYYGDEFGDVEGELKFLFSGERVSWIPGEDLATFISVALDFAELKIRGREPFDKWRGGKSELMLKILRERKEPFRLLGEGDAEKLRAFLGANVWRSGSKWRIMRDVFPGVAVEVLYDGDRLDASYSGKNVANMERHHLELLASLTINHAIRYITVENYGKTELPDICYKVFSRMFTKEKGWSHHRTQH
ncbi:MAG: hypothetical protein KIH01_07680 [Candidatus Freyarchaeota archaeon]|nr:hypothetical protein [Candidatus Jordarchaeia archaeon]